MRKPNYKLVVAILAILIVTWIGRRIIVDRNIKSSRLRNCSYFTPDDLLLYSKNNKFPNGIPRIIHYDYKDMFIPSQYIPLATDCVNMNPDVLFVLWTDESAIEFIKKFYPTKYSIYTSYLNSSERLKKSDLLRFFMLFHFGGVYMDLDTRCQKPIRSLMVNESCFLSKEVDLQASILWDQDYMAANSFMACVSRHLFFGSIIEGFKKDDNSHIMYNTGPIFLTNTFKMYIKNQPKTPGINDTIRFISVMSSDYLSPLIEPFLEGRCKNPSGAVKTKGCKDLVEYRKVEKKKINDAVVVHLFYHFGYEFAKQKIRGYTHMCGIAKINVVD